MSTRWAESTESILSGDDHQKLRAALAGAGLDTGPDAEWDSLDVVCVLAVLEHTLDMTLDPVAAHPRSLRRYEALVDAVEAGGVRSARRARLTLELPSSGEPSADDRRERRRTEYRLALAHPDVRFSVSRCEELRVLAVADSPSALPLSVAALSALGCGETASPVESSLPRVRARYGLAPEAGAVVEDIKTAVREFVTSRGGHLWPPAESLITVAELRELGYYDAHPEQVIHLGSDTALLPAACLGSFTDLGHGDDPVMATFDAVVFRREPEYDAEHGRLPTFTCREILWTGDPVFTARTAAAVADFLEALAERLGLHCRWAEADDPFYLSECAPGRKHELRVRTAEGEITLASVNRHGDHFTERGYVRSGWTTGCAGLGLERWVLALSSTGRRT
ncbi:hypothetical protein BJF83_22655 [Nocardiopsis sp. CNR-923]|uniref:hypothetical protein n=1 Tax=Nocardiopsis sp. CNR-923 TaxID=1904965 RepID=UPI0009679B4C|nr:hypothetical protein [Nocardiopsis sp. CNR-923]OLT25787.1 hypothetical protein BJF83_22655 [Nocardiopsis sp. CNR-923]